MRWFLGLVVAALLISVIPLRSAAPAKGWGLPGLVAAYGFDEGTGTSVTDQSGFGNVGDISGATWTSGGRYGGALSFDGVNDWVTVPGSASLDLTTGMTLSAWVKPHILIGKYRQVLLKEMTGGLVYGLYANTSRNVPQGSVYLNGRIRSVAGSALLPVDTWTALAITFDNSVIRLYVNGVQVDRSASPGP